MQASTLLFKAKNGTLTCSEVLEMLMSQPTHDETSHAHLHTLDRFQHDEKKWAANYANMTWYYQDRVSPELHIKRKRNQWDPAAHLFPRGLQNNITYSDDANCREFAAFKPTGVLMDARRLANSSSYNHRTGLPEIPAQPEVRKELHFVLEFPPSGKGAPTKVKIGDPALAATSPYNDEEKYVQHGKNGARVTKGSLVDQAAVPMIPAVPPHSMFPDSESMVLHLTAALLSDAGINILGTLDKMAPGGGLTLGIFSKTAVKSVRALANSDKAPEMIERTADVAPGSRKDYTGKFTAQSKVIDHVVVVLSLAANSSVIVATCYPSNLTTAQTIKTATAPDEDVEEHIFGTHNKTTQLGSMPKLSW